MVGLEWYPCCRLKHNLLCFSLQHGYQELATILLNYHIGRIVLGSMCVGVSVWLVGMVSVWQAEAKLQPATWIPTQTNRNETPTHIETRTHNQCGDQIEKSHAHDDGCINVRNMLSTEKVN